MSLGLLQFGLTAFVTLTVVVDPFSVAPIFSAMTRQMTATERKAIVTRAVMIAFTVTLFFLLAGRAVLSYLGVTVHAFAISGGILLLQPPYLCCLGSALLSNPPHAISLA